MYVRVCICMYVRRTYRTHMCNAHCACMYSYVCYVRVCMYYVRVCMYDVREGVYMCVCGSICMCTYVLMCLYVYVYASEYMRECECVFMCVFMCEFAYVSCCAYYVYMYV